MLRFSSPLTGLICDLQNIYKPKDKCKLESD